MTIRVLHVGVGIRGRHWLEIVRDHPDFTSVACVDADPTALATARAIGGAASLPCFGDLDSALASVAADAALIASPSALHASLTRRSLDSGLAVLVEKPFTGTVEEARNLLERERVTGKPVVVAENFRFAPAERTIRDLVRRGLPGKISSVSFVDRRRMPSHTQGAWAAGVDYAQLLEVAVHHFDSLRSVFEGQPLNVSARVWNPPESDYRHGACTEALLEMEGGVSVQYLGTLTSHRYSCTISIEGEHGTLWTNRRWVFWRPRDRRFFRPVRLVKVRPGDGAPYPREGTTSLLEGVRDAIAGDKPAETCAADNIWTIAMLEAAMRSDRERRAVSIAEVYDPGSVRESA